MSFKLPVKLYIFFHHEKDFFFWNSRKYITTSLCNLLYLTNFKISSMYFWYFFSVNSIRKETRRRNGLWSFLLYRRGFIYWIYILSIWPQSDKENVAQILFSLPDYLNHTGWHVTVLRWIQSKEVCFSPIFLLSPVAQAQLSVLVRGEVQVLFRLLA